MTLASRLVDYIEGLTLSQGRLDGERFRLAPWQKRFPRGFLKADGNCALSIARANGKSTLIAGIALAALEGPLMEPNAEVVAASSFDQGKIVFNHCLAFMGDRAHDNKLWRLQDSTNRVIVTNRRTGASLRCIGSDPKRMHGMAPRLVIGDELAQWEQGKMDRVLAALETSVGKIEGSRAI